MDVLLSRIIRLISLTESDYEKFVLLFTCMFFVVFSFAQTDFQDLSLDKALEKAKVENKLVFMDCYTSWCGPCKMMAEKILPLKEVGEYMNGRFVCIKVDMEKGEGPKLAQKYQVSAYPTFLVNKDRWNCNASYRGRYA